MRRSFTPLSVELFQTQQSFTNLRSIFFVFFNHSSPLLKFQQTHFYDLYLFPLPLLTTLNIPFYFNCVDLFKKRTPLRKLPHRSHKLSSENCVHIKIGQTTRYYTFMALLLSTEQPSRGSSSLSPAGILATTSSIPHAL